jgi:hypothetical protein
VAIIFFTTVALIQPKHPKRFEQKSPIGHITPCFKQSTHMSSIKSQIRAGRGGRSSADISICIETIASIAYPMQKFRAPDKIVTASEIERKLVQTNVVANFLDGFQVGSDL